MRMQYHITLKCKSSALNAFLQVEPRMQEALKVIEAKHERKQRQRQQEAAEKKKHSQAAKGKHLQVK